MKTTAQREVLLADNGRKVWAVFKFEPWDSAPRVSEIVSPDGYESIRKGWKAVDAFTVPSGSTLRFSAPEQPYTGPLTGWDIVVEGSVMRCR